MNTNTLTLRATPVNPVEGWSRAARIEGGDVIMGAILARFPEGKMVGWDGTPAVGFTTVYGESFILEACDGPSVIICFGGGDNPLAEDFEIALLALIAE